MEKQESLFEENIQKMLESASNRYEKDINLRNILKRDIEKTTYLTHGIHNFYPAKFIPQVPRFVINLFNLKNKIILDPFAGSGTTAVESLITGNSNISNDINPISEFLIRIKTLKLENNDYVSYRNRLNKHINSIRASNLRFVPNWSNLDYWYEKEFKEELCKIWGYIHNIEKNDKLKYILVAAGLYVSRKYSHGDDDSPKLFRSKHKKETIKELIIEFDKNKNILVSDLSERANLYLKFIIELNQKYRFKYSLVTSPNQLKNEQSLLILRESIEKLEEILPKNFVDCIITSPPYIYAQEYFRSTKIDSYWLNLINDKKLKELTKKEIGQKRLFLVDLSSELNTISSYKKHLKKIKEHVEKNKSKKENIERFSAYFNDMLYFIKLSKRLLADKGILAIFIGEPKVFGEQIDVKDIFSEMMEKESFIIKYKLFDIIKSRNLTNGRLNLNPDGIKGEWLIIGEKNGSNFNKSTNKKEERN